MLRSAINRLVQLTDQDWELLVPHLTYRRLNKGEYWITEGKKEQQIGFVLNGNMRHYYTHDGEEKTTYSISKITWLALISVHSPANRHS